MTRQRQFVADASHELRNPVAGIRTDLEAALCEDDADWPTVAREVLEVEARLETLPDDLLVLAAEDEGATASSRRSPESAPPGPTCGRLPHRRDRPSRR